MNVDYYSDYNCPYCYIGITNLRNAAEELDIPIEVSMHSFELNPNLPDTTDEITIERLVKKYIISEEQAKNRINSVERQANDAGINIKYFDVQNTNSFNAHRLTKFAKTLGLEEELSEALYKAHFENLKNLADLNTLVEIAESVGINKDEAREFLESDLYANEVRIDEEVARNNLIHGVPYFILDQEYVIPGALNKRDMIKALEQILEQEKNGK